MKIPVLFENTDIIAFDKPPGMLVIPDQYTARSETLAGIVSAEAGGKLLVVHRIDRDTSGVVVFAKNEAAHRALSMDFQEGRVKKKYLALLSGVLTDDSGIIDTPILVEARKVNTDAAGKPSITEFSVIEKFRDFTLVEARPLTGRRHQIRVHFRSIGHPLAVDPEYRSRDAILLSSIKRGYKGAETEKPLISRLTLHASELTIQSGPGGKDIGIKSPLPKDFAVLLKQLRKYDKE
ncbi:MAG: RluA family pseudouridine synthase [Endomicrobiales bacterium]|nr:RluA family pseudouridine synthase [Endomicrobiales bacterium]